MRVIAWRSLRDFAALHPASSAPLAAWFAEAEAAIWTMPSDIQSRYASASFIANNRVVFNIKGNNYRLIVKIHYDRGFVYIRFVGTHEEYDKVNAATI